MDNHAERPAPDIDHVRAALREHDADNAPVPPSASREWPHELPEEEGSDSGDVVEDPGRP